METVAIRSMLALLVLLGACSLIPVIQANDFTYCTPTEYPVKVHDLEISPQPVVNGHDTTFTMTIIPEVDPITSGKWKIEISNSSEIVIPLGTYNICSETTCPVKVNQLATLSKTNVYKSRPPGNYTLTMRIISGDCDDWVCVNSDFEIVDSTSYIRKVAKMYV